MSGLRLSQEDRELLGDWWDEGTESDLTWDLSTLSPVVERIVTRAVNEALTEAADAIDARCVVRNLAWEIDASERSIYADAGLVVLARRTT